MAILANITIPATQEKTADKYWLSSLHIKSMEVGGAVEAFATLIPYNSITMESFPEFTAVLSINDVLSQASYDAGLANCMNVLLEEISVQCKKSGAIS